MVLTAERHSRHRSLVSGAGERRGLRAKDSWLTVCSGKGLLWYFTIRRGQNDDTEEGRESQDPRVGLIGTEG